MNFRRAPNTGGGLAREAGGPPRRCLEGGGVPFPWSEATAERPFSSYHRPRAHRRTALPAKLLPFYLFPPQKKKPPLVPKRIQGADTGKGPHSRKAQPSDLPCVVTSAPPQRGLTPERPAQGAKGGSLFPAPRPAERSDGERPQGATLSGARGYQRAHFRLLDGDTNAIPRVRYA